MGTPKGFTVSVGGSAGLRPRLGDIVVKDLSEEQVLDLVERIISFYKGYEKPRRIGEVIDEIGIEEFKTKVGLSQ
jgi:NAD(P)H-nitrite reductase large subunit